MGKRRKMNATVRVLDLSLDEQLRELDEMAPAGPTYGGPWIESAADVKLDAPSSERVEYVRRRQEIVDRLRRREAKRLADPGPDEGGRLSPSPHASRGHSVEDAPKDLRSTPEGSFPKRIATQRMHDRYHRQRLITHAQWKAADRLWQLWDAAGWNARIIGSYAPFINNSARNEGQLEHRVEAADEYLKALKAVPHRAKGVVVQVVIMDISAGQWAKVRGYGTRVCGARGLARLRQGLSALAAHFGC